jgi:hypothetical protein
MVSVLADEFSTHLSFSLTKNARIAKFRDIQELSWAENGSDLIRSIYVLFVSVVIVK